MLTNPWGIRLFPKSQYGGKTMWVIDQWRKEGFTVRLLPELDGGRKAVLNEWGQASNPYEWWELNTETSPIVNIGRKVFALYNGQYYEAVCRAIRKYVKPSNDQQHDDTRETRLINYLYLVQFFYEPDDGILHYEWLNESELYPYEFKSKQLKVFYQASPVPKVQGEPKKMSSIKKGGNKQKAKWTKKKKEPIEEDAFDSDNDSHLKIPIPAAVRKRLLDDGTMINTEKTVVPLPKKPNVHEILTAFFQEATSIKEDPTNPLDITVNDFTRMFNIYIGLALLYRYERPQYEQIFNQRPKVPMAAVYGAEHLLRLCAKLPSLIVKFNENTALIPVVLELMMFLKDNMTAYFVDEYSETDDNYFIKLYS